MASRERVISADSHVNVPVEDWQERLPERYRGRAPRRETTAEGDFMLFEGRRSPIDGLSAMAGRAPEEYSVLAHQADLRSGGWDPNERMKDQDTDGVSAEILFGGGPPGPADDIEFRVALYRAYNDWLADFCRAQPRRLFGIGYVPVFELEGAVAELRRIRELGHVGALLPTTQNIKPYADPYWDPLWRAAEALALPLHFHAREGITVNGARPPHADREKGGAWISIGAMFQFELAAELLWSGVYERFPGLRIGHIEGNIGWIPYLLERADQVFENHRFWTGAKIETRPSELWRRNCFASFVKDHIGVQIRERAGVDNVMWSSDYPHSDTLWPHSIEAIDAMFEGVPPEDREKIVATNAIRLYDLVL